MSDDVKELVALGRDSVISLAKSQLEQADFKNIDTSSIDRISVLTDGRDILVTFERSIQFVPQNTRVIHSASTRLLSRDSGWSPLESGDVTDKDLWDRGFYSYAEDDLSAIEQVLGSFEVPRWQTVIIYDKGDHYSVTELTESSEGGYKVDKSSGQEYDEWHMHLAPNDCDDGFEEVVFDQEDQ